MRVLAALAMCAFALEVAAAQDGKIGFVDLQRALNESESGKKAKEEFKVEMEKLQKELKKRRDEIEALRERIEKKALVLKEEERRKLEKDYQRQMRDFERAYKDSQAELQAKDTELTGSILRDLQQVIQQYGEREGYLLILEASNNVVLYGAKSVDLTDKIIEEYNRQYGHEKPRD